MHNIKYLCKLLNVTQLDISNKTGILTSRLSRIVKGADMYANESSLIAKFFGISTEMLLNEDLSQRFELREDYEKWQADRETERQVAERRMMEIVRTQYLAEALLEDYVSAMAQLTGEAEQTIRMRILDLAQRIADQKR